MVLPSPRKDSRALVGDSQAQWRDRPEAVVGRCFDMDVQGSLQAGEAAIDMVAVPTIAEVWVLSIALTLRSARFGHWTMGLLDRLNASGVQISVARPAARNLTSLNVQPLVSCSRDPIECVGSFYRASATTSCVRSGESAERKRLR